MKEIDLQSLQAEVSRLSAELSGIRHDRSVRSRSLLARLAMGARVLLVLLAGVMIVGIVSYAAQIALPWTFQNGTVADANQVNENFSVLVNESNSQDTRITSVETNLPLHLLQDGSEPFTGSLTVNQNLQVNGSTTLGNTTGLVTTVNDVLRIVPRGSEPDPTACDTSTRGSIVFVAGSPDVLRICIYTGTIYSWRMIVFA